MSKKKTGTETAADSLHPNEVPCPRRQADSRGVVNAVVYAGNKRICDVDINEAGKWAQKPNHIVWIGLCEPKPDLLAELQKQFNLHPLAIEDANQSHQRTKVEQYGESLFIVARTAEMVRKRIVLHETHIFVGKGYVITIRHGGSPSYATVRTRYEAIVHPLKNSEQFIVYSLLDFIVDNYMPLIEILRDEVEELEDQIMLGPLDAAQVERLYHVQRDLLRLRTAVAPMFEVCKSLEHGDLLPVPLDLQEMFRDVTDHVRRVQDEVEILREVLVFAFEANMMMGQAAQSDVTRKLASWAAILAVPTAIAGIYGMNFKYIPETDWHYGYFTIVAIMFAICFSLFIAFKRNDWL
jgi:magnesium Mg(2+) and cobalt Co(2+) transport protein (corA)